MLPCNGYIFYFTIQSNDQKNAFKKNKQTKCIFKTSHLQKKIMNGSDRSALKNLKFSFFNSSQVSELSLSHCVSFCCVVYMTRFNNQPNTNNRQQSNQHYLLKYRFFTHLLLLLCVHTRFVEQQEEKEYFIWFKLFKKNVLPVIMHSTPVIIPALHLASIFLYLFSSQLTCFKTYSSFWIALQVASSSSSNHLTQEVIVIQKLKILFL